MARLETRVILLALIGCWAWRRLDRVVVSGVSMAPTLRPGDQLLVLRTRHARAGDLVVVRDPREPSREVVKRLVRVTATDGLVVAGDNPETSTDSRTYGPVPRTHLIGRALPLRPRQFLETYRTLCPVSLQKSTPRTDQPTSA